MPDRRRNDAPPASTAVARAIDPKEAYQRITQAISEREEDITRTLAKSIPRERFLNVALQAITRSPKLLECTPSSFVLALRDAAELGLEPSGLLGSAYLVPYRNKESGRLEAKLIPGYRGLIDLARRSGEIAKIEARMVRERDSFDYEFGTEQFIRHKPFLNVDGLTEQVIDPETRQPMVTERGEPVMKPRDAGPWVAAYVMIVLRNGEMLPDLMSLSEINSVRRRSKAADDGPWVTDFGEMGKKTVTRRTLKYAPFALTSQLNRALELDDEAEQGAGAVVVSSPPATARAKLIAGLTGENGASPEEGDDKAAETEVAETVEPEGEQPPEDDLSDLNF